MEVIRNNLSSSNAQVIFQDSVDTPAKTPQVKGFRVIEVDNLPTRMDSRIGPAAEYDLRLPFRQPQKNAYSLFQFLLNGAHADLILRAMEASSPVFNF